MTSLVKKDIIKKVTNNNAGKGVEKRTLLHCWWECKLIATIIEKSMEVPSKAKNRVAI